MNIVNVAVVGGGAMGVGIVYTISNFGFRVFFKELNDDLVKKCQDQLNRIYSSALNKGKMTEEEVKKALRLIHGGSNYKGFEEVDLVIEAVPEDVVIKKRVFQEMLKRGGFLPRKRKGFIRGSSQALIWKN